MYQRIALLLLGQGPYFNPKLKKPSGVVQHKGYTTDKGPEKVKALLKLLDEQVNSGRCTPGPALSNDRDMKYLP